MNYNTIVDSQNTAVEVQVMAELHKFLWPACSSHQQKLNNDDQMGGRRRPFFAVPTGSR